MPSTLFGTATGAPNRAISALGDEGLLSLPITPPAGMVAGQLVVLDVIERATSLQASSLSISDSAGQTWVSGTLFSAGAISSNRHWCVFDGNWIAVPEVYFDGGKASASCELVMSVYSPSVADSTWAENVAAAPASFAAAATVTPSSVTTVTNDAVVVAMVVTADDNTHTLTTPGSFSAALLGYNNTGGNDICTSIVYVVKATAGATGTFTLTETTGGTDAGLYVTQAWVSTARVPTIAEVEGGGNLYNGLSLAITGSGFGATQGASTLKVKTADGTPSVTQTASSWSSTRIAFTLNSTALPFGDVTVEVVVSATPSSIVVPLVSSPGKANSVANVTWPVGAVSVFASASPAVVDGDLYEYETLTDQNVSVEVFPDGTFVINSSTDTHKFDIRVFDQTDETWSAWSEATVSAADSVAGDVAVRSVYALASVVGLRRWVDYIPVKVVTPTANDLDTFNDAGALETLGLASIVGKVAWVDYLPVYVVTDPNAGRARYDDLGWIAITDI